MTTTAGRPRGGVRHHRRCAFVVFCAFCVALLCVVAFNPGVVVVVAVETSDDESVVGDTKNVSGEKTSSSFAFATPASKGLSANSLEVRGRCDDSSFSSRSIFCFVVLYWRARCCCSSSLKRRDGSAIVMMSRGFPGEALCISMCARDLFFSLSFFHHRPHNR